MTRPLDVVLDRLQPHGLRKAGAGKWRAQGVCHGGSNPSSLAIAEGDDGQVLVKCWHGCDVDRITRALGLDLADLFPPRVGVNAGFSPTRRRRLVSPREALDVIEQEVTLVFVAAQNLAAGFSLLDADRLRLAEVAKRIQHVLSEARS